MNPYRLYFSKFSIQKREGEEINDLFFIHGVLKTVIWSEVIDKSSGIAVKIKINHCEIQPFYHDVREMEFSLAILEK